MLCDQAFLCDLVGGSATQADWFKRAIGEGDLAAATLRSGSAQAKAALLAALVDRIALRTDGIDIALVPFRILSTLGLPQRDDGMDEALTIALPATKVRRGHQLRLVIPGPDNIRTLPAQRDEKLVALIADAYAARQCIMAQPDRSIANIASSIGRCRTRLAKLVSLSCLAPDIVTAIIEGRQPSGCNARTLLALDLPLSWREQRRVLDVS